MVRAVVEAVGDRAIVIAGASSNDPVHASERARLAAKAGAHALLVVSPYYNRPPQEGVLRHLTMVADSTELPVMLYDIPARTGVAIDVETMVRAAEHEKIVAVKDAKGDLAAASWAHRADRPGLVLRRRRAQPSAAEHRRGRRGQRRRTPGGASDRRDAGGLRVG